ncbi:MAG: 1-deoxy-D-xylulose-5-phosphate reductoisomerase [Actinomycetota bacterium]|nr:1-deoxy-D-xylulose-5-phosphate reductoisomerase [Actinomycetota bacterium]
MKKVVVLGSTGSIGTQTCDVAEKLKEELKVIGLVARSSAQKLIDQCVRLGVDFACLVDEDAALVSREDFVRAGIKLSSGIEGLFCFIDELEYDIALNSLVGSAGLEPTLRILKRGKSLALANKESMVAGGELVMEEAKKSGARIVPVDSEHSAIFQCLQGENGNSVRRIILTASGGPFRNFTFDEMKKITVSQALAHPTWNMGPKVTVDSATLMNKGLEILEAHHLFSVGIEKIEVAIHPQSIVHSMVEMQDGSVLAQLGAPDMRTPIQYALTYPERSAAPAPLLDILKVGSLTFEPVDNRRFPCLELAKKSAKLGKTYPVAMNAANEEAVSAFLMERIAFTDIAMVVEKTLERHIPLPGETLGEIMEAESAARVLALEVIGRIG